MTPAATPASIATDPANYDALSSAYKQLAACQALRTPLVAQMDNLMHNATFNGAAIDPITAQSLTEQASELITDMRQLNAGATPPNFDLCGAPRRTRPVLRVLRDPRDRRDRRDRKGREVRRVPAVREVRPVRRRRSPAPPRSTTARSSASPARRAASRTVPGRSSH